VSYTPALKKPAFAHAQAARSESKIDYAETEKNLMMQQGDLIPGKNRNFTTT
jgi:hypothetical protein